MIQINDLQAFIVDKKRKQLMIEASEVMTSNCGEQTFIYVRNPTTRNTVVFRYDGKFVNSEDELQYTLWKPIYGDTLAWPGLEYWSVKVFVD